MAFAYHKDLTARFFQKLTTANNANIEITNDMKKKDEFLKTRDEEILSLKAKVNEYETLTSSSQVAIKISISLFIIF